MTTITKFDDAKKIQWDLSDLCSGLKDPIIESTLTHSLIQAKNFEKKYKTHLNALLPSDLAKAFSELEALLSPLYKVSQYISLRQSIETQDNEIKALDAKIDDVSSEVSTYLVFFSLEIAQFSQEKLDSLKKEKSIENYIYSIEHDIQTAAYNLSESEEKIITIKDVTGISSYKKLYTELTSAFKFTFTVDGEEKTMTGSELRNLRYHKDATVRREAMKRYYERYQEHKITITHIFNYIYKDFNTERQLRGYKSPIAVRNIGNDLSEKAVQTLHDVTTFSNTLVRRYYTIKKKLLGLETMTLADLYAPLPDQSEQFSYEEAKTIVLEAFKAFDNEFYTIAKMMFDENRIHAPVLEGKSGGAFCSGSTPDVKPYVMLNFLGKARDVSTMAHELGHAIHDVLASKQSLFNYHPILPLAETASVFCEMLVTDLLLKKLKNNQDKIALLCDKLEDVFATSHRQNMFSCFEQRAHQAVTDGLLSSEDFSLIYYDLLKEVFADSVQITDDYKWEWCTIPHFINYPFYVYAYNFGNLLVFSLYQQYKEEGASFIPKLKETLSSGCVSNPIQITSYVNADIESKEFWNKSVTAIESLLNELESLI
jgi:oligoendopeptidase F